MLFSKLENISGYWKIMLGVVCKDKTIFVWSFGTYQLKVMYSSLMNDPSIFQTMMHQVLTGLKFVHVYLDDVVILSNAHEDHMQHLKTVIDLVNAHGLKLKIRKFSLAQDQVELLGHILDA